MYKKLFICTLAIILCLQAKAFSQTQETLTVTTYYPSPRGVYRELKSTSNTYLATDGGSVGIGTTSANYKLDVTGDINTTGDVRKNGTAYINPDYVFEPDYKLLPLIELKKFVAEKRHLPNMPSTEEIKKEGVKIFEQNRLLLEKLEEAYLYIIKLEERITNLENTLAPRSNAKL